MRTITLSLLLTSFAQADLVLSRRVDGHLCIETSDHPATVAEIGNNAAAVLSLPKPRLPAPRGDKKPEEFTLELVSEAKGCAGLAAVIHKEARTALDQYTASREPGERMEPVLSLRDIKIVKGGSSRGHESATLRVPNEFEMVASEEETDLEDYLMVFHVRYVPTDLSGRMSDAKAWCVTASEFAGKCLNAHEVLKADFDDKTGRLTLYLKDSAYDDPTRAPGVIYVPTVEREGEDAQKANRQFNAEVSRRLTFVRRVRVRRKPLAFRAGSQVTSSQMPVSLNFGTTSTFRSGKSWANVYTAELHVNQPFTLRPIKTSRLWNVHHGPELHYNGTTGPTADDVNSASAGWLLQISRYFQARCVDKNGECGFTRPAVRRFAFEVQPKLEMTANGRDKNMVLRAPYIHFYAPKRVPLLANATLGGNIGGGFETGRALTSRVDSIEVRGGARMFSRTLRSDLPIRRGAADANLNIVFKKDGGKIADTFQSVSLDFEWKFAHLFEPEQAFRSLPVDGRFRPNAGEPVPPEFVGFNPDTTFSFLVPSIAKGSRRFYAAKLNFEIGKDFSFFATYERGMLAPAFQFTNRVRTGVQFQVGGKQGGR